MITLFSIPKAFKGGTIVHQENAIASWLALEPRCEIILFGDDDGVAEAAKRFGVKHVPGLTRNELGTPRIDVAFKKAQEIAVHPLVCWLNGDDIVLSDFVQVAERLREKDALIVGRRRCVDLDDPIDFRDPEWEAKLSRTAREAGELDRYGLDYFLFPRGLCRQMPPFVTRAGWDNWPIYDFRARGIPVIDATDAIVLVHPNHGYTHHPDGKEGQYRGGEAKINIELAGGESHLFSFDDVTHVLSRQGLRPALSEAHLKRRRDTAAVLFPHNKMRAWGIRTFSMVGLFLHRNIPRLQPIRVWRSTLRRLGFSLSANVRETRHAQGIRVGREGREPENAETARENGRRE